MIYDVVITEHANETAILHLLTHLRRGLLQEDLCFALWSPSTGNNRTTAIVHKVVLPRDDERELHGGASFLPAYLTRSLLLARSNRCGLAFMHSHLTDGWQDMSEPDIVAERDVLASPARTTKLPLVGLTVGTDGYWSARFWIKSDGFRRHWCTKVRVVGKDKYSLFYNNDLLPPPPRRPALQRTYDTWGAEAQSLISRLHVGVVGLGSVGSVVTEALARVGVPVVTLVDPDVVEEHNLDRLLNATQDDVGRPKVDLARAAFASHATTASPTVHAISESIHTVDAYRAILDCDIVFSCVDRPVARDVLNYVSQGHLVPVLDGGIAVGVRPSNRRLSSAHWRCHVSTPLHPCLRCRDQYNTSMVVLELDGSLDDPSYTQGLDEDLSARNQNVFPFTLSLASMLVNLFLRYIISEAWWPKPVVAQQEQQFVLNTLASIGRDDCEEHCAFRAMRATGDAAEPPYLLHPEPESPDEPSKPGVLSRILIYLGTLFRST